MSVNAEHYKDPTASRAVREVAKEQPLQYFSTPVYVNTDNSGRRFPYSSTKVKDMNMAELRPYITNCAKAKMNPINCIGCEPGCAFGKRAAEIMEQEKRPQSEKHNRGIGRRIKSMQEYQAAIASGDVLKYAMEHAKSSDPKKAKAAAYARVAFWRKNYGGLIKEAPKPKQDPAPVEDANVAKVFAEKLASLRKERKEIRKQIKDLESKEDSINKQITTIMESASMLGVVIT